MAWKYTERYKNDPEFRKIILKRNKKWREQNKDKVIEYDGKRCKTEKRKALSRKMHQEHKEERLKKQREYHWTHRKEILERQRNRFTEHREENKESCRRYYKQNKEKLNKQNKERHKINREHNIKSMRKYLEKNKETIYEQNRIYRKTESGKKAMAKHYNKRKRELGFNILFENEIIEEIDWHHVNNEDVVAVPRDLHTLYGGGNGNTDIHRQNLEPIIIQLYPEYGVDNV